MPTQTSRVGINKPLGNESVTRESLDDNWDIIDGAVVVLGTTNQIVNKVKALDLKIDTRNTALTYTGEKLTQVQEKDGAFIVKVTTLNYDGSGVLTSVAAVASGTTVTTTLNYTSGKLATVTKVVT